MIYDQYPTAESKTVIKDGLIERALASISGGSFAQLLALRIENSEVISAIENSAEKLRAVADILQPPKDIDTEHVRWRVTDLAQVSPEQEPAVLDLADEFGLRLPVGHELPDIDDPLLIIESGANRTSIVRRGLAEDMLGEDGGIMYQFGSSTRMIAPTHLDRSGKEVDNPEYKVISADDICGALDGRTVSEFDVNIASAINAGYEIIDDTAETHIALQRGNINLIVIKAGSLKDGVAQLADSGVLNGRNVVVSTNGQYCTKSTIRTESVIAEKDVTIASIQAIGDGDETGKRGAKVYIVELAAMLRELSK